jgi:hypothetical protein
MALSKIDTAGLAADAVDNTILDLAGNYAFTGTVTGAGAAGYTKTAQTTTSGAATYSISSIPSGTSELILFGNQVDRGTSSQTAVIRLGDSGGLEDTGYNHSVAYSYGGSFYINTTADRTGLDFQLYDSVCNFTCHCWNTSGNKWMMRVHMASTADSTKYWATTLCEKELSGTLDRIGIVDRNGTNFAGGTIQLWYK